MAALTKLESEVSQFVTAMQHANFQLSILQTTITSIKSESAADSPNDTSTQDELTTQFNKATEGEDRQKRVAFEDMRRLWLEWGQGVMRTLDLWMERKDIGIADRVVLIGLADRLAWYGVRTAVRG